MTSDPAAALAKRCISSLLDVPVVPWDVPPREGAYDLQYQRLGRTVAVEVKLLVDPSYRAAESASTKVGYTQCSRLTKMWIIDLDHAASWKKARQAMPDVLAALERCRWTGTGEFWQLRRVAPDLADTIADLGIESAWPHDPTDRHPPGFYLMPTGWGGGIPGIDATPAFCDEQLRSPKMTKLRRQLADADADERHAFFVVGWEHMIMSALTDELEDLPAGPPELVDGIDGVWITPLVTNSRVLAWLPGEGWKQADAPTAKGRA